MRLTRKKPLVIIIRGAPSTGKTTVACEIRKRLANSVILNIDGLIHMNMPKQLTGMEKIKIWNKIRPLGYELTHVLVSGLLKKKTNLIIEEIFLELAGMKKIIKLAKRHRAKVFVFELIAPIKTLLKREGKRAFVQPDKPVKEAVDFLAQNPYSKAIKIDTSKQTPEEIASLILAKVKNSGAI